MVNCTHLEQVRVERPEHFAGCEDCLAIVGDVAFVLESPA
jgi:hypothetical protein